MPHLLSDGNTQELLFNVVVELAGLSSRHQLEYSARTSIDGCEDGGLHDCGTEGPFRDAPMKARNDASGVRAAATSSVPEKYMSVRISRDESFSIISLLDTWLIENCG